LGLLLDAGGGLHHLVGPPIWFAAPEDGEPDSSMSATCLRSSAVLQ